MRWAAVTVAIVSITEPGLAAPSATAEPSTPLGVIGRAADVGTDGALEKVLAAHGQRPDHQAPPLLRKLLAGRPILRMSASEGYLYEDGRHARVWWFSEIGFAGEVEEVSRHLEGSLAGAGFTRLPTEREGIVRYRHAHDGVVEEVTYRAPELWVGPHTACGTSLGWLVREDRERPAMTLGELLRQMPYLEDARIDPGILGALSSRVVVGADLGGTRTRYYSLTLTLKPLSPAPGAGQAFQAELAALLTKHGFTKEAPRPGKSIDRYHHPGQGAHAQVYPPNASHEVRVHIQPRS